MNKLQHLFSELYETIFSKEVIAALVGAFVLIWGYFWTSNEQQNLEKFKFKSEIYSDFLVVLSKTEFNSMKDLDSADAIVSRVTLHTSRPKPLPMSILTC